MKIKRISKKSVKYFFASALLSAVFIVFVFSLLSVEANTRAIGFEDVSKPLYFEIKDCNAVLTVNDRVHSISIKPVFDFLSEGASYIAAVFLML